MYVYRVAERLCQHCYALKGGEMFTAESLVSGTEYASTFTDLFLLPVLQVSG